jgi:hypothetical protein
MGVLVLIVVGIFGLYVLGMMAEHFGWGPIIIVIVLALLFLFANLDKL